MAERICIDGSFLSRRFLGTGVHSYTTNLLQHMEKLAAREPSLEIRVLAPPLEEMESVGSAARPGFELIPCPAMRQRDLWRLGIFMLAAKRLRPDVLFLPFPYPIYYKAVRLAVMVHDVIPLLPAFRRHSLRALFFRQAYSSSMRRADLILTNSEYSKADMVARCGVASEKILAIHLGFDPNLYPPALAAAPGAGQLRSRLGIEAPYILWVGNMEPRKNLLRLVEAFGQLRARRADLTPQLVLCGGESWGCETLHHLLAQPFYQGKVIRTGPLPSTDLSGLYRGAAGLALPSLYEGFGLPLLEAMACGAPVICANRSSLPEVAGPAALYFDPESVPEISAAMERLLTDADLRLQLAAQGKERIKQFSWETCARATLEALRAM